MIYQSIRWRLPLSYAAIAFLTTLALGVVLLTVLRGHYANQERAYLENNARVFSQILAEPLSSDNTSDRLQGRVQSLAFLSEARIQLRDIEGNALIDSGPPRSTFITFTYNRNDFRQAIPMFEFAPITLNTQPVDQARWNRWPEDAKSIEGVFLFQMPRSDAPFEVSIESQRPLLPVSAPPEELPIMDDMVQISHTPFGYNLKNEMVLVENERRSDQRVEVPIFDVNRIPIGFVSLSDGPAYGLEILDSVALGWLVASMVAVIFAALAGWIVSRQLTEPLLALTEATTRMASGDLGVRNKIDRKDELGLLASAFNEMGARIENTIVTLRRFVADAAHELHTPLTALRTNVELATEDYNLVATKRALEQINRLQSLADDLLDLSRIEANPDEKDHQTVNITTLICEISEIYASRAEQAELDFVLDVPTSSMFVKGDAAQLYRLFGNLLDNAIKFTDRGGWVKVKLSQQKSQVQVIIEDTGIGIPPDDLPQLFERFRRGRNTANYPGSGLGLAIVKAIANTHHSTVEIVPSEKGATFTVSLPVLVYYG